MDHLIRNIRPKAIDRDQRRFREEQESCVLCGSRLAIRVEKLSDQMIIREVAECPRCQIRARSTEHPLL